MPSASPEEALAGLKQLQVKGADVPLVLADQWMPGRTGVQFLARVRELHPTARRGLLISWGDQSAPAPHRGGGGAGADRLLPAQARVVTG